MYIVTVSTNLKSPILVVRHFQKGVHSFNAIHLTV